MNDKVLDKYRQIFWEKKKKTKLKKMKKWFQRHDLGAFSFFSIDEVRLQVRSVLQCVSGCLNENSGHLFYIPNTTKY